MKVTVHMSQEEFGEFQKTAKKKGISTDELAIALYGDETDLIVAQPEGQGRAKAQDAVFVDDADLETIYRDLDEAQRQYEKVAFLAQPTMPCDECGGSGTIAGGSLGNICPTCCGARVIDAPYAEELSRLQLPDFGAMRKRLNGEEKLVQQGKLPDWTPFRAELTQAVDTLKTAALKLVASGAVPRQNLLPNTTTPGRRRPPADDVERLLEGPDDSDED